MGRGRREREENGRPGLGTPAPATAAGGGPRRPGGGAGLGAEPRPRHTRGGAGGGRSQSRSGSASGKWGCPKARGSSSRPGAGTRLAKRAGAATSDKGAAHARPRRSGALPWVSGFPCAFFLLRSACPSRSSTGSGEAGEFPAFCNPHLIFKKKKSNNKKTQSNTKIASFPAVGVSRGTAQAALCDPLLRDRAWVLSLGRRLGWEGCRWAPWRSVYWGEFRD